MTRQELAAISRSYEKPALHLWERRKSRPVPGEVATYVAPTGSRGIAAIKHGTGNEKARQSPGFS